MFDIVEVVVTSGDGGRGAVSFRREKFIPFGGPDGGDGGDGGSVYVVADQSLTDLRAFKHRRYYHAGDGEPGRGKKQHGGRGKDVEIRVPVGTVVSEKAQVGGSAVSGDLGGQGERLLVAKGGRGGLGNCHFASSTNQSPRIAQEGEKGEEKFLILELKLIADVGIIGYPNVGKSTLLAAASAARPKIADYAFTTTSPVLGVVEVGRETFVLAEIPGLISGAHLGRGLGHDFLRHVSRTRLLIHLVDGMSSSPVEDMSSVNTELSLYDSALAGKRQVLAVNKVDLPQVRARLSEIGAGFAAIGVHALFISAETREGVTELMTQVFNLLERTEQGAVTHPVPKKIFHPRPRVTTPAVHREGDTFVVTAPELERIVAGMREADPVVRGQLRRQLQRKDVVRALTKAGVKAGDRVRCGDFEWEWQQ
ncbi:MAG TPA: GTPase ObgE [Dehalococcoidia bacterium]|nr:GTPase ObgE [Dehalococcoidia bacterium]